MSIRQTIAKIIETDDAKTPDETARLICGFLSCECCLDNGNGWYDDDPEMSAPEDDDSRTGLNRAEEVWLAVCGQYRR